MSLREQIEKALNTPFNAAAQGLDETEYLGLGVWHNAPTLKESWIKISRELNTDSGIFDDATGRMTYLPDPTAKSYIDILDETGVKGTGKGEIKDGTNLKKRFDKIKRALPPGEYGMNADHPTKARMYQRTWLKEPGFRLSGETARGKRSPEEAAKLTKKGIPLEFETMIMTVPGDTEAWARDWRTQGVPQTQLSKDISEIAKRGNFQYNYWAKGAVPDNVVRREFAKYIKSREKRIATGSKRALAQFKYKGMYYGFSSQGINRTPPPGGLVAPDGRSFKVVPSSQTAAKEAARSATKLGQTPTMNQWEWKAIQDLYDFAGQHGFHVDHIKPLEKRGQHIWSNLQVLDADDNLVKGAKEGLEDFFTPKMKGVLKAGPMDYKEWRRFTRMGDRNELAKAKLLRDVGKSPHVGAATASIPLAPSSGLGGLQRKLGTVLPIVGAGFDAWDVQQRMKEVKENPNNQLDKLQLGLATATLGTSFWAEPANMVLGLSNLGIDAIRTVTEEDKREDFLRTMRAIGRGTTYAAQQATKLL